MSAVIKSVQSNGDVVTLKIDVSNPSANVCNDVRVVFTLPTGIALTGPTTGGFPEIIVPKGSYDPTTETWWIGNLDPGAAYSVDFEFTAEDISQADPITGYFVVSADLSALCNEEFSNNKVELVIKVGQACVDDNLSIGSGEDVDVDISIG